MIGGFQHVGIGVSDTEVSWDFYKKVLNFRVKLNDHEEEVKQMEPVIGSVERMRMLMSISLLGGAAVEIVQHKSSEPRFPPRDVGWGDVGYLSAGLKVFMIDEVVSRLKRLGIKTETPVAEIRTEDKGIWKTTFLRDPDGILLELLETTENRRMRKKPGIGGFSHVTIGSADLDRSREFYASVLGFNTLVWELDSTPQNLTSISGDRATKEVMLSRLSEKPSALPIEDGMIRIVESSRDASIPAYEGRRWGDVGIMEIAFDVLDIEKAYRNALARGAQPFCEPTRMDMGSGSVGYFAYVKDPDGNIIEMVEVEKLAFLPPRFISPVLRLALAVSAKI